MAISGHVGPNRSPTSGSTLAKVMGPFLHVLIRSSLPTIISVTVPQDYIKYVAPPGRIIALTGHWRRPGPRFWELRTIKLWSDKHQESATLPS